MREAKIDDYWRESFRTKKYQYVFDTILIDGKYGFEEIKINKGIFAICGLNGAGKSTIISYIKDVIGIDKNEYDNLKISGTTCTAKIENIGNLLSNIDGQRLIDSISDDNIGSFIEYHDSLKVLNYLNQSNLDELLEQFESNDFTEEEIELIGYLVGKEYDSCILTVIDNEIPYPYFAVTTASLTYNSLSMGLGEHYLFYLFWKLKSINKADIVIIEEPETFVSIKSQERLMNFIAKLASKYGISFIITTHSPFILKKLESHNICVLSRFKDKTSVSYCSDKLSVLKTLGIEIATKGILFFEDKLALTFFNSLVSYTNINYLLEEYDTEIVKSESEITNRLKFNYSENFKYKLIGVYDGDMKVNKKKLEETNKWPFIFLPGTNCLEKDFKRVVSNNIDNLEKIFNLEENSLVSILSDISGVEAHDWLYALSSKMKRDYNNLVNELAILWINEPGDNKTLYEEFLAEIRLILK
ncbi:ATP-dependent nuclease [Aliarcobacter butzleri]|uniref:ATP-dependent nuclease n=1 Tax=Aliarcobacter butzleri TaxID=28197 RepID=UPI003B21BBA7